MSVVFEYSITILEKHLDNFGHVNNATYLNLYEEARWQFITEGGYGLSRVLEDKIGPVLLDLHLVFKKELINREKIMIISKHVGMKNRLVMCMEQVMLNENKKTVSTLNLTWGLMDLGKRRLIKPTDDWLSATGAN